MDTLRNHKLIIINIIGSIIPYCVFPWLIYLRRWLLFRLTLQSFCFPFGHLFLHLLFLRWHRCGSSPFGSSCPLGCRYSFGLCRGRLHSWALTCSKRHRNAIQTNTNNKEKKKKFCFYRGLLMQWLLYISGSQMGVHVPLGGTWEISLYHYHWISLSFHCILKQSVVWSRGTWLDFFF